MSDATKVETGEDAGAEGRPARAGYAPGDLRRRVISMCDERNEIGPLDDGYQYYWIKDRGALSAAVLRIIADELDRRNADWDAQVRRDLGA